MVRSVVRIHLRRQLWVVVTKEQLTMENKEIVKKMEEKKNAEIKAGKDGMVRKGKRICKTCGSVSKSKEFCTECGEIFNDIHY